MIGHAAVRIAQRAYAVGAPGRSLTLTFITSSGQQTVGVGVPTNLVRGDVYFYNLFLDRFNSGFHRRRDPISANRSGCLNAGRASS